MMFGPIEGANTMQLINPFRTGLLKDCEKGDLIALSSSERRRPAYAVLSHFISDQGDHLGVLAVLRPSDQDPPHLKVINSHNDCINLGSKWIFEVEMPDAAAAGSGFEEDGSRPGIVTIAGSAPIIRLGREPGDTRSQPSHFNFSTMQAEAAAPRGYTVSVGRWAVWLNEEQRSRVDAEPLFRWPTQTARTPA
ncbi:MULTISPECIES: hypothetical protein [unclassified Mesorhizobium]|uniref:hypothetical protein n=2 Tax=Mesorhizobium TaxID=68287 RepID=UPI000FCAA30D|nr:MULTISPECIES: hypothetical protein [unclassified Mesorhizobium]RUY93916.1 hypothetical protein EN974_24985 [Mesorhizobium sp. M7A.F.Ca.CA.001.12.2.1]RUZ49885.1 hypothetical protein EN948_03055 [Mesorhizobium sp. M7A.F.Ca.US.003.02.1.1]RUZ70308.1 hypothetical protein EN950_01015 [Mesorhizobium sp. M7A.F.Ca.US.007.01.1.1]